MKNTISTLTEKVILMRESKNMNETTVKKYEEVMNAKASIRPLKTSDDLMHLFEIIILKPPAKLKNIQFSALKWNNIDYTYTSQFLEYNEKFLKAKITPIAS